MSTLAMHWILWNGIFQRYPQLDDVAFRSGIWCISRDSRRRRGHWRHLQTRGAWGSNGYIFGGGLESFHFGVSMTRLTFASPGVSTGTSACSAIGRYVKALLEGNTLISQHCLLSRLRRRVRLLEAHAGCVGCDGRFHLPSSIFLTPRDESPRN